MLLELYINNFAIIENLRISFNSGLNILTGETGTGKSIIIDAINLILGGRATKDYIRAGADKAVIEALFSVRSNKNIKHILDDYGIEYEEDNTILITREINISGKSVSRINGRIVTLSMLNEITNKIIDIHGQHEHQSLLYTEKHIEIIDSLGKDQIYDNKVKVSEEYLKLSMLKNRLKELTTNEMEKERKLDLLKFQLNEIDEANLQNNEEDELTTQYSVLSNIEEISNTINETVEKLNVSSYREKSIIDQLNSIYSMLSKISKHDEKINIFTNNLESIIYELKDLLYDLRNYSESIELNPEKLMQLEERLGLINKLKRKYGKTVQEIIEYRQIISEELNTLLNCEEEINNIRAQIRITEEVLKKHCDTLTVERKKISSMLENLITEELNELNMSNVSFKIKIDKFKNFTRNGIDKIEFLISTNPGESLKPLSKIVSGGEMSRIMLAFKSILAEVDNIETLVFDEIDTGISGRTAQIVGEKITKISNSHQIICITHLPQIAAMADTHFMINKKVVDNVTLTEIKSLKYNERINELSRLLGGFKLTDITMKHAAEMLEMSKKIKNA